MLPRLKMLWRCCLKFKHKPQIKIDDSESIYKFHEQKNKMIGLIYYRIFWSEEDALTMYTSYFIFQTQKDVSKKTNDKDISASHQGILSQIKWHQQYVRQNAGVLNLITVLLRKVIKLNFFFNGTCNVLHTSLMTNISSSYIFTK